MRRPVLALIALVACVAAVTTALTVVATDNLFGPDDTLPRPQGTFIPDENLVNHGYWANGGTRYGRATDNSVDRAWYEQEGKRWVSETTPPEWFRVCGELWNRPSLARYGRKVECSRSPTD